MAWTRRSRRLALLAAGLALASACALGATRVTSERANAARFVIEVGNGASTVPDHLPPSAKAAAAGVTFLLNDRGRATLARVTSSADASLFGIDGAELRPKAVTATTVLPLADPSQDGAELAFAAVAQTARDDGRLEHVGLWGIARGGIASYGELGPVDAFARDEGGRLFAIVPCHAPPRTLDPQTWANIQTRCVQPLPDRGALPAFADLPTSRPLCEACSVRSAWATGGKLRAWTLHESRDNVLVVAESGAPARPLATPAFTDGPGFVHAVAWARDGASAIVGEFSGRLRAGDHSVESAGGPDAFVVAYDAAGHARFAQSVGTAAVERGVDAVFLPDGSLRVLVTTHSDVPPAWTSRALHGKATSTDGIEIVELDARGETLRQRRYALGRRAADARGWPGLVGADPQVAAVLLHRSEVEPLVRSAWSADGMTLLVVGLSVD